MKALQMSEYGAVDVLSLNDNAPKTVPGKDQMLIEVHAASINPIDWKVRTGYLKDAVPFTMPATLGGDCCGIVAALGESAAGFKVGDRVYGYASLLSGGSGSFAEFVAAKPGTLALAPRNVGVVDAAALPLVGASAVQAVD
jgi:NADPH:quinone reductase-like Zn-dependent oxidoreductase